MKWIKDFIYDHNDLLVALLIILAAGTLIYGRMNDILDYPARVSAMSGETGQTVTEPGTTNPGGEDPNGGATTPGGDGPNGGTVIPNDPNGGDTPGGDNPGGNNPGGDNPGGDDPNGGQTTPDPQPVEYVSFKVAEGQYKSWEQLAKGMQSQGIIDDYWPLYKRVLDRVNVDGIESYTFYVGTYRLPKGADVDTLIDIIRVYPTGD